MNNQKLIWMLQVMTKEWGATARFARDYGFSRPFVWAIKSGSYTYVMTKRMRAAIEQEAAENWVF